MFGWFDDVKEWIFETLLGSISWFLDMSHDMFGKSMVTIRENVSETPTEFSATIVETLRAISTTAILPIGGLLLTYIFCYELYQLVVEKNRGNDFETGQLMFLIFKTAGMILLLTHSFDITLAFFDLGQWITNQIPQTAMVLPDSIRENILESIPEGDIGQALGMWTISVIVMIVTFFMSMIIYLVAWSRMVTIMLYISVAPIPFATFMNNDWIGSVGQTYVKNLMALMLQGYFMIICLIIYGGLLEKSSELMITQGTGFYGLVLMLVSMAILVISLTRTHSLAKSVMGVV
ncbi:VirB6/TrbL-like conjugal transfer protein, CD1112 family [Sporosarcina sp. BP05]|uniref:VirB6/TrbL-like conjugal transfer protein, CD1112 family n=1 Tax=Sporosarcina sp. BP05 TaxID=2758726 RepID=UPI00164523C8|nr:CD0415/CD1112 family protein [Sporosarcina sp. BP05]